MCVRNLSVFTLCRASRLRALEWTQTVWGSSAGSTALWRPTGYRSFATQPSQGAPASKTRSGGLTWFAASGLLGSAIAGYAYMQYESHRHRKAKLDSYDASVGAAQVGGPFKLKDTERKPFSDEQLRGEFAILYFGFTHCPDICPDELEKMASAIDMVEGRVKHMVQPVFITIDPDRDSPKLIKEYVKEFHPRMIGLWGSMAEVKEVAKRFRVYFMKTNDSATDYLVDHSIIMYLINPDGKFVTFYGKSFTGEQVASSLCEHIQAWRATHPEYKPGG